MPKILIDPTNKILSSAAEVLKKVGEEDFSMRLVAKKAKVSVGTIYNYYPNKEELLKAVNKKQGALICKEMASFKGKAEKPLEKLYDLTASALGYGEEENNVLEALNKGLRNLYREKEEIALNVSAEIIVNAVMKNREKEAILPILTKVLG